MFFLQLLCWHLWGFSAPGCFVMSYLEMLALIGLEGDIFVNQKEGLESI